MYKQKWLNPKFLKLHIFLLLVLFQVKKNWTDAKQEVNVYFYFYVCVFCEKNTMALSLVNKHIRL